MPTLTETSTNISPDVAALRDWLARVEAGRDLQSWAHALPERKRDEANFHDWARDPDLETTQEEFEENHPNFKYYAIDHQSARHREEWIEREAPGRIFLDYACGRGTLGMIAAQHGAALSIGIDISPVSIARCRRRAAAEAAGNTHFMVADCERTELPDNSVDRIVTAGCLHHLDLSYAFPELRRILKPGGRIYAIEALAHNPFIQLYRRLTPHLRTAFETKHILSMRELRFAQRFFDVENLRFFHLCSLAATPLRNTRLFRPALTVGDALDNILLRVPPISYLAWQFSFELVKRPD